MKRITPYLSALVLITLTWGCGESNQADETADTLAVSDSSAQVVKENVEQAIKQIPSPTEIPALLELSGANYEATLVNDTKKVDTYLASNTDAAFNLGVYATDLGYVVTYEKTQEAIDYLQTVKKLTDKLGVTSSFDANMVESFQKNVEKPDTLAMMVDNAMKNVDGYLRENQRTPVVAMVFAGSFVEGLYISTGLVQKYPKDLPKEVKDQMMIKMIDVIIRQKATLKDVIAALEAVNKDEKTEEVLKSLKEVEAIYEKNKFEEKIANNQGNLMITDKDLVELTAKIQETRAKIVN